MTDHEARGRSWLPGRVLRKMTFAGLVGLALARSSVPWLMGSDGCVPCVPCVPCARRKMERDTRNTARVIIIRLSTDI